MRWRNQHRDDEVSALLVEAGCDEYVSLMSRDEQEISQVTGRRRRRASFRRRSRKRPYKVSLNLTAMIDTVFNLLFLFIMISRFGALEGMLPAQLPARVEAVAASPNTQVVRMPIRIRLLRDETAAGVVAPGSSRVTIEHLSPEPMLLKDLPATLRNIRDTADGFDASTPVHLLASDDVAWNDVVDAYNAAMTADFQKIYFAGSP